MKVSKYITHYLKQYTFLILGILLLPTTNFSQNDEAADCELEIEAVDIKPSDCGENNGAACVKVTGAKGDFQLSWGPDTCYTNLQPGQYCVHVTDEQNCHDSVFFEIKELPCEPCELDIEVTDIKPSDCDENNGAACVRVTGAKGDFQLSWGPDTCYTNLQPGQYCVHVTDEQNCHDSVFFEIEELPCDPCGISSSFEIIQTPDCNTANGSVAITTTGAVGNVLYFWNGIADTSTRNDLPAGTYQVIIMDAGVADCMDTLNFELEEPECCLEASPSIVSIPTCNGNDGAVTIIVTGTSNSLRFFWNGVEAGATRNDLPRGAYTVRIEEEGTACELTIEFDLMGEPCDPDVCNLAIEAEILQLPDCNEANGAVNIVVTGAEGTIRYFWNGVEAPPTRTDLEAGDYEVVVLDETTECMDTIQFLLLEAENCCGLSITNVEIQNPTCEEPLGSATIIVEGGIGALRYFWNGEESTASRDDLPPGMYQVIVIDEGLPDCSDTITILIAALVEDCCTLQATAERNSLPNCGLANGSVSIITEGAQGELTYLWNGEEGPATRDDLVAGVYQVIVMDNGVPDCMIEINFFLFEDDCCLLSATATVIQQPNCNTADGIVEINVMDAQSVVTFDWGDTILTEAVRGNLATGDYTVIIRETESDCADTVQFSLRDEMIIVNLQPDSVCIDELGQVAYTIRGCFEGPESITVLDGDGNAVDPNELPIGSYTFIAIDINGEEINRQDFEIIAFDPITFTATTSDTCSAAGFINLMVDGGNENFLFDWSDLEGTDNPPNRGGLDSGLYQVQITSLLTGCSTEAAFPIDEANGPNISLADSIIICRGDILTIFPIGENLGDVTYEWTGTPGLTILSPTSAAPTLIPNSETNTLSVTVTSADGCVVSSEAQVISPDITPPIEGDMIITRNCKNTTIEFDYINGNAAFYEWNFGDPNNPDAGSTDVSTSYTYSEPGNYVATLMLSSEVFCQQNVQESLEVPVEVTNPVELAPSFNFTDLAPCQDTSSLAFVNTSTVDFGMIDSLVWIINGEAFPNQEPTIPFTRPMELDISLEVFDTSGCKSETQQNANLEPIPQLVADNFVCAGMEVMLGDDDSSTTYIWTPNPFFESDDQNPTIRLESSFSFSADIIREDGSCERLEDSYAVAPVPAFDVSGDRAICPDAETMLTVTRPISVTIEWSNTPDFSTTFSQNETITVGEGTYYLRLQDPMFQFCSIDDTITINERAVEAALNDTSFVFCTTPNEANPVVINLNGDDNLTYEWSPSDLVIANGDTDSPTLNASQSANFSVAIENQLGCTTTRNVEVLVTELGITDNFDIESPDAIGAGGTAELTIVPPLNDNYMLEWQTPGTVQTSQTTWEVSPTEDTQYNGSITDELTGCSIPISEFVNVSCTPSSVFVPNAFSPNGDGTNEVLFVRGAEGFIEMNFIVFNRWGQQVFETNDPSIGWDGRYDGDLAPSDVYGYYLTVTCPTREQVLKGNISLLR